MAIVAEVPRGRVYLPCEEADRELADCRVPENAPSEEIAYDSRYLTPPAYGLDSIDKFFSPRQITALVTLSDLTISNHEIVRDLLPVLSAPIS